MPARVSRITPKLKGLLKGTSAVSKVHVMNLATGVMISWRFMGSVCFRENSHLSACCGY